MKYLYLLMWMSSSLASATPNHLICTGQIAIDNPWGAPAIRTVIVEVDNCASRLGNARVEIQSPGVEPFKYSGEVHLDGLYDHRVTYSNGEVSLFKMKYLPNSNDLIFEIGFYSAHMERYGGAAPVTLHCGP